MEKRIARGVPSRFFADRAEELARGLAELERSTPAGTPAAARLPGRRPRIPDFVDSRSVDLVLSSPPYAGVYDYAEHHAVRFRWLGLPMDQFRRRQLGERSPAKAWACRRRAGRRAAAAGWWRWAACCAPKASAVLVVGDGVVGDRAEDAAGAVAARRRAAAGLSWWPAPRRRARRGTSA